MLLLLPTSETKLIVRWQGPYKVIRRTGPVDYEVETPDKKEKRKIFHVNLLKKWQERASEAITCEELGPDVTEIKGEDKQEGMVFIQDKEMKEDLQRLKKQFQGVFSKKPGKTNLVHHCIKIKERRVVRLPPRRWPKHFERHLTQEIEAMEKLGVIEPSQSEWRSHPVLVPKPDG